MSFGIEVVTVSVWVLRVQVVCPPTRTAKLYVHLLLVGINGFLGGLN